MSFDIVIYSPDRHITYDGAMPDNQGVGGGITSRVRLASALAKRQHNVEVICNCDSNKTVAGVKYVPLDSVTSLSADVLIVNSSGGAYDISPIQSYSLNVGLKVLWVSGVARPGGIDVLAPDLICAKSNFLRDVIRDRWDLSDIPIFVIYNGYPEWLFEAPENLTDKDPYRIIYSSHPDKGLKEAIHVISSLRQHDSRYHLEVLGSEALWGQTERTRKPSPGVRFMGTVPQHQVAQSMKKATFSLCLQGIEEGFGLTVLESMRSGCVTIASSVGAYPELISDSHDGVLIKDHYRSDTALHKATNEIKYLNKNPSERKCIQVQASQVPWSWTTISQVWLELIDLRLGRDQSKFSRRIESGYFCASCGSPQLQFADGFHCNGCGKYCKVR